MNRSFQNIGLAVLGWALVWHPILAQDNPFAPRGGGDSRAAATLAGSIDTQPGLPTIDPELDATVQLVVRNVIKSNPQRPADLVTAVSTLLDIEQFEFAKYYLERLNQIELSDEEFLELSSRLGSDVIFRIHSTDELRPIGPAFARKAIEATRRAATAVENMQRLVRELSHEKIEVRSSAYRELRRLGQVAIGPMLEVFADRTRFAEFASVRDALRDLDAEAVQPLLAASRAQRLQVRYEAFLALAMLDKTAAYDAVVAAWLSPSQPAALREDIGKVLQAIYGRLPESQQTIERIKTNALELLRGEARVAELLYHDKHAVYVKNWYWDDETDQLKYREINPATAGRILAAQRIADLATILPDDERIRQLRLLSHLDALKRLQGPDIIVAVDDVQREFTGLTAPEIERALNHALDLDLIPAACGACQLLGQFPEWVSQVVRGTAGNGLIRALQSGDRHTQFAAFDAIIRLDPQQPYPGSSYVLEAAVFFSNFGDRPNGIIGHNDIAAARNFATVIDLVGLTGRGVVDGRELFADAISDANLQVIMISETLGKPFYPELVQQLRNDWRTKRLPIAILTQTVEGSRAARLAASDRRLIAFPETSDPTLVALQVDQLLRLADPWSVDLLQGRLHSHVALEWLVKVSKSRDKYGFYDLLKHDQQIANLLFVVDGTQQVLELLGFIGSQPAQRALLDFASQYGLPIDLRRAAAASFGQAIQQRGVLLTTSELDAQINRYNVSQGETGESQRVLGSILDMIEQRAGKNSFRVNNTPMD